jgi:MFS transporter, YNFM family, putative membrane transport protein
VFPSERSTDVGTVALLAATGLMVLGLLAVWIPLGPALEATYGVSAVATALAGSIFAAGFAVGELVAGPLADRYGLRPVLVIGLAALSVASVAAAASPDWSVHLAIRVVQGIAAGSFAPVALAWVAQALPAARRTTGLAVVITAYQASAITGQLYGQVVGQAWGWRAVYVSLAGGYVLAAVALARWVREPQPSPSARAAPGSAGRRLLGLLGVRPLLASWLLSAVLWGALIAMYAGLQAHLPTTTSQGDPDTLLWIRIAGLVAILAVPALLAGARGRATVGLMVAGVTIAAVGLIAQVLSGALGAVTAGSALVAGGSTLAIAPLTDLISQFAPAGAGASALSIQSFMLDLGASGGAAVSARLGYTELCGLLAAAMAVVTIVLTLTIRGDRAASSARAAGPESTASADGP